MEHDPGASINTIISGFQTYYMQLGINRRTILHLQLHRQYNIVLSDQLQYAASPHNTEETIIISCSQFFPSSNDYEADKQIMEII